MARLKKSLPKDIRRENDFFIEPFLNKEDGLLYYIDTKGFLIPLAQGDGSIYVTDGTLISDRTLSGANHYLHFNGLSNFTVQTTGIINLDPDKTVDIKTNKSISYDADIDSSVTIAFARSEARTNIQFASPGGGTPPTDIRLNAFTDLYLSPNTGNTTFTKNLAFYTTNGGEIADIDAASGKVLITKEWISGGNGGIYAGSGSLSDVTLVNGATFTLTFGDSGDPLDLPEFNIFSNVGIGAIANSNARLFIEDNTTAPYGIRVDKSGGSTEQVGIFITAAGASTETVGGRFTSNASTGTGASVGVQAFSIAAPSTGSLGYKSIGILASSGVNTTGSDSVGGYFNAVSTNPDDNYGIHINSSNSGAGTSYIGVFNDNRTAGVDKILTSIDANGTAEWRTFPGVTKNIYTQDGTTGSARVVTITDTLAFNSGKVTFSGSAVGIDFEVTGDALINTLTLGNTGQYKFPLNATISNDTQVLAYNHTVGELQFTTVGGGSNDKVKITSSDTTTNYLEDKISAGSNITITKLNASANEELEISATAKKTWTWGAARNASNTTNSYLRVYDGTPNNQCTYVVPFNCELTDISCSTLALETWDAQVHVNGSSVAQISVTAAATGTSTGLSVAITAGDQIAFYCNGSGINKPHIQAWFRET